MFVGSCPTKAEFRSLPYGPITGFFLCADKITQGKNNSSPKITQAIFEITQGIFAKKTQTAGGFLLDSSAKGQ